MELQLQVTGFSFIVLALIHIIFPKYFNWKIEFGSVSMMNRQMMYVHTFFIALVVFLMGLLCLTSTNELINSPLGKRICLGMGIFWLLRLIIQFFGYSSLLWKGKKFETIIHILFSFAWTYFTAVFFAIWFL